MSSGNVTAPSILNKGVPKVFRPFGDNLYDDFCFLRDNSDAGYFEVEVILAAELRYQPVETDYIATVQEDGLTQNWRTFISKWLYKVSSGSDAVQSCCSFQPVGERNNA